MRKLLAIFSIIFVLFYFLLDADSEIAPDKKVRKYDCGMAEWHPDIPKEVKEACRRMRSQGPST